MRVELRCTARTQLIWKPSTTNQFIRPTGIPRGSSAGSTTENGVATTGIIGGTRCRTIYPCFETRNFGGRCKRSDLFATLALADRLGGARGASRYERVREGRCEAGTR